MKKFLVFLSSIVVMVFVGLTTYYFMKNDEVISVGTKEIYCNAGDIISLEELGIERKKPHKKTEFNYNAGGENVTSAIEFDYEKGYYVVKGETAGDIELVISTTNEKYAEFKINVHIGNGAKETPFYIFNEVDLSKIGAISGYGLDKCYKLMSDITLPADFNPIGYNALTEKYDGFSGEFDGNNHSIIGMSLSGEYNNAGFFSSLNKNSKAFNLTFVNSTINGAYDNAGILAGSINSNVDRIQITNATITNTKENGKTGTLAGTVNSAEVKMCGATNIKINVGTETEVLNNVTVGGLVGLLDNSSVKASFANGEINVYSTIKKLGGLVGSFLVNDNSTTIQQSYASVSSTNENFALFVGTIEKSSKFIDGNVDIFYLIGNIAVGENNVVNTANVTNSKGKQIFDKFFDAEKNKYMIYTYKTNEDFISSKDYVFYAISSTNKVMWDTDYVWNTSTFGLPSLKMGSIEPETPSSEYFQKDFTLVEIFDFATTFKTDRTNAGFELNADEDLTSWRPVSIKNCVINGNNHTIRIRISNATNNNAGIFSVIDGCTIKNLNIVITGVTSAENVGALAGKITSSNKIANTTIDNVTVTFENPISNLTATNFGAFAGLIENTNIKNSKVTNLKVSGNIQNVGGVAGTLKSGTISDSQVSAEVSGIQNVGGIAGVNSGKISNVTSSSKIVINSANDNAKVGGVAGANIVLTEIIEEVENKFNGIIASVNANVNIKINSANNQIFVGGVAGTNEMEITNTTVTGTGIEIAEIDKNVFVGGVTAVNNGTIVLTQNKLTSIGSYYVNKNIQTGGIAYQNNGVISKVVVSSNIYGNYAAGLVVLMNNANASVDQVLIQGTEATKNEIKADKFVAGFIVNFQKGSITNIQAESDIVGGANYSISSLVALVFENGSAIKNATVNSSIGGYGTFYRETWTDFKNYSNKALFGITNTFKTDGRYDICIVDNQHGSMQSVVFNGSCSGFGNAKFGRSSAFMGFSDYDNTSNSSYVKVVYGFTDISQFTGKFDFLYAVSSWFKIKHYASKELTFVIGAEWMDNGSGISLSFLNEIK